MRQKTLELEQTVIADGGRRGASARHRPEQNPKKRSREKERRRLGSSNGLRPGCGRRPVPCSRESSDGSGHSRLLGTAPPRTFDGRQHSESEHGPPERVESPGRPETRSRIRRREENRNGRGDSKIARGLLPGSQVLRIAGGDHEEALGYADRKCRDASHKVTHSETSWSRYDDSPLLRIPLPRRVVVLSASPPQISRSRAFQALSTPSTDPFPCACSCFSS